MMERAAASLNSRAAALGQKCDRVTKVARSSVTATRGK
jgi:hypothetical protein